MRFKAVYHIGGQIEAHSKLSPGRLTISTDSLSLSGSESFAIPLKSVTAVELLRPQPRLPIMVRVLGGPQPLFLTIVFFRLFGLIIGDVDGTIRLYDALQDRMLRAGGA